MSDEQTNTIKELAAYAPDDAPDKERYVKLVIKQVIGEGKPLQDLIYFLQVCKATGLNPVAKQIYAIYRSQRGKPTLTIQTGIDGLRSIAERSGQYGGSDAGKFEYGKFEVDLATGESKSIPPRRCTVTVYKVNKITGERMPTTATALWNEYYPKSESFRGLWDKMPETMLEKCAEAKALRKAFPLTSQLYVDEEMHQAADNEPKREVIEAKEVDDVVAEITHAPAA